MAELETMAAQVLEKRNRLAKFFEKGSVDGRPNWTTEETETVRTLNVELADLGPKLANMRLFAENARINRAEIDALNIPIHPSSHGKGNAPRSGIETKGGDGANHDDGYHGLGDCFLSTKSYKGFVDGGKMGVYRGREDVESFSVKTLFQRTAGFDPFVNRQPGAVFSPQQQPRVIDMLPIGQTSEAAIKWMLETTYTNTATETAEATAYPEAVLAYQEQLTAIQKIGQSLPITDEQLADAPQVRDILNNRLDLMLRQRLDSQLLNGSGNAPYIKGLLNVSGINTQTRSGDPGPDALYKAMVKILINGFCDPSGIVMHPTDWQNIRLLKTADGLYIYGHPSQAVSMTLWGLPVVSTTYQPVTTALVGAFVGYTQFFYRTGIEFETTNSNASDFVAGRLMIRAQMRGALVCYRPLALCSVTGL